MALTVVSFLPKSDRATTAHHGKDSFQNPWPSFHVQSGFSLMKAFGDSLGLFGSPGKASEIAEKIPVRKPTWGVGATPQSIKATWLGHAGFLVEMPRDASKHGDRGVRILFDPVFSHRCSPYTFLGPQRFTPAPCPTSELPEVDIIVISHNHYDHMDTATITELFSLPGSKNKPHIFAPLGNEAYFKSLKNVPDGHGHTLDWWGAARIETEHGSVDLHCTPAQHMTGRGVRDRFKSLWASWAVVGEGGKKVWFAGDTGYRNVPEGADENQVPFCPAFRDIGQEFGGFDYAMIPIGAYEPQWFMRGVHCAPSDSVRIFQDVKAKCATGMHWGTWHLTVEDIFEPPRLLKAEMLKAGLEASSFSACSYVGETVVVE